MKRAVAVTVLALAWGGSEAGASSRLVGDEITVRVYMSTGSMTAISGPAIVLAQEEASRLFEDAGVRLDWRTGSPQGLEGGPGVVELTFEAAAPAGYRAPQRSGALAVATPYGINSGKITVFGDRVEVYVRGLRTIDTGRVLGHVLAHEIGHVLEGIARHSESGLMKAHWSRDDYAEMLRSGLGFAEVDRGLLRVHLPALVRIPTEN